jgi:release factor glutamine methyltransferase
MTTLNTLIVALCQRLAPVYPCHETQVQHAWWILEYVTGLSRLHLLCADTIDYDKLRPTLEAIVTQHVVEHKPLAYIMGAVPFCQATILVEPPVLIPRMETEEWVERLIEQLRPVVEKKLPEPLVILDMCSGSGCIAIALATAFPSAHITAVDIATHAIELIKKNIQHNHTNNIIPLQSDLFESLEHKPQFDLIVSNPPYITPDEYCALDHSVKNWEDPLALWAEDQGLALIKNIVEQAQTYIRPNPLLQSYDIPQIIIEIGHAQANVVKAMMLSAEYNHIDIHKDFAGKDRIVTGRIDDKQNAQKKYNVQCGAL